MDTAVQSFLETYFEIEKIPSSALQPLLNYISVVEKPKGTMLIKQGYRHSYSYFILQGLARVFYQKEDSEVNFWFGFENETLGSIDTLKGNASKVSIELLEPCCLIQYRVASKGIERRSNNYITSKNCDGRVCYFSRGAIIWFARIVC